MKYVVQLRNGAVAVLINCPVLWLKQGWAYIGALVARDTGELVDPRTASLWTAKGEFKNDGTAHPFDVVSGLGAQAEEKESPPDGLLE